jgi:hypothetical protein
MPVTPKENQRYGELVSEKATQIGLFDFPENQIVWHYTDGPGLLGIIESGTIHATQVAFLNDRNETKYATDLFKREIENLVKENEANPTASKFLNRVLEYIKEDPTSPTHGTSKFFVACFSGEEDDLSQWDRYGKKNGYAIGFHARGLWREPTSTIYKVVYDKSRQVKVAQELAQATLQFYLEGLTNDTSRDPNTWAEEFFPAWDEWTYKLAPLAKDPKWRAENEFRLVHELKFSEFHEVRFRQCETMLARYLPLKTPLWARRRIPILPIAKIIIGPSGTQPTFTRISVALLLQQMGYPDIPIELSQVSLQRV